MGQRREKEALECSPPAMTRERNLPTFGRLYIEVDGYFGRDISFESKILLLKKS